MKKLIGNLERQIAVGRIHEGTADKSNQEKAFKAAKNATTTLPKLNDRLDDVMDAFIDIEWQLDAYKKGDEKIKSVCDDLRVQIGILKRVGVQIEKLSERAVEIADDYMP